MKVLILWVLTPDKKVLLILAKKEKMEKYGDNLYQPIQGWQRKGESDFGTLVRLIEEKIGDELAKEFFRKYRYSQKLPRFFKEDLIKNNIKIATRYHFLWEIPEKPFSLIDKKDIKFIGIEDLKKIKPIGTSGIGHVILFKDDYKILTDKIFNLQTTLGW